MNKMLGEFLVPSWNLTELIAFACDKTKQDRERRSQLSALDVGGEVDLVGQLRDVNLEPLLHLVENLGVSLLTHHGDGKTLQVGHVQDTFSMIQES